MSEGSRGNGPADNGSADDFYATVSASAGANRSTRVRHGGSTEQPATGGAEAWTRPSPEPESHPDAESGAKRSSEPAAHAAHAADAADAGTSRPEAHGTDQEPAGTADGTAAEPKSWRDRWNSITAAVSGKQPKVSATGTPLQTAEESKATEDLVGAQTEQEPRGGLLSRQSGKNGKKPTPYELATARLSGSPETSAPPRPAQPETPAVATIPVAAGVSASATAVKTPEASAAASVPAAAAPKPKVGAARRTRKARLRLSRLDPWSVMKTAFLFSIAAGIVLVVAVYVVWTVIGSSGLFASVNDIVGSVVSTPGDTTPFRVEEYVNTQKVMGVTAFIACIDVVIFTALATLASFLYNLAATMLGGLEVTLAED